MNMQNKTLHIMHPLLNEVCFKGYDQNIPTFHTIAKRFHLTMKLINYKWNHNIYDWKRRFPTCVTKVSTNKDR